MISVRKYQIAIEIEVIEMKDCHCHFFSDEEERPDREVLEGIAFHSESCEMIDASLFVRMISSDVNWTVSSINHERKYSK